MNDRIDSNVVDEFLVLVEEFQDAVSAEGAGTQEDRLRSSFNRETMGRGSWWTAVDDYGVAGSMLGLFIEGSLMNTEDDDLQSEFDTFTERYEISTDELSFDDIPTTPAEITTWLNALSSGELTAPQAAWMMHLTNNNRDDERGLWAHEDWYRDQGTDDRVPNNNALNNALLGSLPHTTIFDVANIFERGGRDRIISSLPDDLKESYFYQADSNSLFSRSALTMEEAYTYYTAFSSLDSEAAENEENIITDLATYMSADVTDRKSFLGYRNNSDIQTILPLLHVLDEESARFIIENADSADISNELLNDEALELAGIDRSEITVLAFDVFAFGAMDVSGETNPFTDFLYPDGDLYLDYSNLQWLEEYYTSYDLDADVRLAILDAMPDNRIREFLNDSLDENANFTNVTSLITEDLMYLTGFRNSGNYYNMDTEFPELDEDGRASFLRSDSYGFALFFMVELEDNTNLTLSDEILNNYDSQRLYNTMVLDYTGYSSNPNNMPLNGGLSDNQQMNHFTSMLSRITPADGEDAAPTQDDVTTYFIANAGLMGWALLLHDNLDEELWTSVVHAITRKSELEDFLSSPNVDSAALLQTLVDFHGLDTVEGIAEFAQRQNSGYSYNHFPDSLLSSLYSNNIFAGNPDLNHALIINIEETEFVYDLFLDVLQQGHADGSWIDAELSDDIKEVFRLAVLGDYHQNELGTRTGAESNADYIIDRISGVLGRQPYNYDEADITAFRDALEAEREAITEQISIGLDGTVDLSGISLDEIFVEGTEDVDDQERTDNISAGIQLGDAITVGVSALNANPTDTPHELDLSYGNQVIIP